MDKASPELSRLKEEIAELRRMNETERIGKAVASMTLLHGFSSPDVADRIAECCVGAEDAPAALAELDRLWRKQEREIRQSYDRAGIGKTYAPEPSRDVTLTQFNRMTYQEVLRLSQESPNTYRRLVAEAAGR